MYIYLYMIISVWFIQLTIAISHEFLLYDRLRYQKRCDELELLNQSYQNDKEKTESNMKNIMEYLQSEIHKKGNFPNTPVDKKP